MSKTLTYYEVSRQIGVRKSDRKAFVNALKKLEESTRINGS